ncbi:MAG: hypothetical protein IJV35_10160 [Neisseriaceae bacterium]|nr:hypothetical protein [Neisseriaceae bacterium]
MRTTPAALIKNLQFFIGLPRFERKFKSRNDTGFILTSLRPLCGFRLPENLKTAWRASCLLHGVISSLPVV